MHPFGSLWRLFRWNTEKSWSNKHCNGHYNRNIHLQLLEFPAIFRLDPLCVKQTNIFDVASDAQKKTSGAEVMFPLRFLGSGGCWPKSSPRTYRNCVNLRVQRAPTHGAKVKKQLLTFRQSSYLWYHGDISPFYFVWWTSPPIDTSSDFLNMIHVWIFLGNVPNQAP